MDSLKDIANELHTLFESLCGKKTIKSWLESVSDSADCIIIDAEKQNNIEFINGELCIKNLKDGIEARIELFFSDAENNVKNYVTTREFPQKKFVRGELDKLFMGSDMIKYPIEHPEKHIERL